MKHYYHYCRHIHVHALTIQNIKIFILIAIIWLFSLLPYIYRACTTLGIHKLYYCFIVVLLLCKKVMFVLSYNRIIIEKQLHNCRIHSFVVCKIRFLPSSWIQLSSCTVSCTCQTFCISLLCLCNVVFFNKFKSVALIVVFYIMYINLLALIVNLLITSHTAQIEPSTELCIKLYVYGSLVPYLGEGASGHPCSRCCS